MTKEQLFEMLKYEEGDKIFVMCLKKDNDGKATIQRINHGFDPLSLIGLSEIVKTEVLEQMAGRMLATIVDTERIVVK